MKVAVSPSSGVTIKARVNPSPEECGKEDTILEVENNTLGSLLLELSNKYRYKGSSAELGLIDASTGELNSSCEVFINGNPYERLNNDLKKGDRVLIIPFGLGGG